MRAPLSALLLALLPVALPGVALAQAAAAPPSPPAPQRDFLLVPGDLAAAAALPERAQAQRQALSKTDLFTFFAFTDQLEASGIRFHNRSVDDAGRTHKMVHYDHGNGVAVADVDGDGLLDLYFVSQLGGNELWRNRGGGRFEDVTAKAGVGLADRIGVTASFADADNDGDADLFVTTVRGGNALFANDGHGVFQDVTADAGVGHVGHSSGAVFFDFDRDGLLDLFVTNVGVYSTDRQGAGGYHVGVDNAFSGHLFPERTEASLLYKNLGGLRFREVSKEVCLVDTGWSGDAAAADVDGNGWTDLYVLNMQGDDHLWLNEGGRFHEDTARFFPKTPWGSMGVVFLDGDDDGRLDLYLTDMHSDMSEPIGPERETLKSRMQWGEEQLQGGANNVFGNAYYRNLGDGRFEEISDRNGTEQYWPWGVSAGDLDANGWPDLFVTASMNYPFRYGPNSLYLNYRGRFLDAAFALGVEPRKGGATSTPWFDLDCKGDESDHRDCDGHVGAFTVLAALGSRSSALFDLDRDGDLDVVTNDFNSPPMVLVSDLAQQTKVHRLELVLEGKRSNRDGLGAVVTVVAGDLRQTQVSNGSSGYLSHSRMPLYFGLGSHEKVDSIEIRWPSGAVQTVSEGIDLAGTTKVVEPAAE